MTEHRTIELEKLDEQEAARFLNGLLSRLDPEEEYDARHPEDYVMEMPQSGERFVGRERLRMMQRAYPAAQPPSVRLRRVLVREGLWVVEGISYYGETRASDVVMISELRDGKMWRDRWYFAEPFEAPEWRARWVEPMEPGAVPGPVAAGQDRTDGAEVGELMDRQFAKMRAGDLVGAHEWYDEAVVVEWPQSGERIRGKVNLLALRESYPADVEFEVRRIIPRRNLGVSEHIIHYDGDPVFVVAVVEFGNGKAVRETHYFADPFPAPGWRAQWVEAMGA